MLQSTGILPDASHGWTALVSMVVGGVSLKLVDWILHHSQAEQDEATVLRHELREEVINLRAENASLKAEVVVWRDKYFKLQIDNAALLVEYQGMKARLAQLEPPKSK